MNTKERIVDEALTLFSVQGFKGTTVKNIADAVGIKDSSIYKHFKSKQEILDAIVDQMKGRMEELSGTLGIPQDIDEDSVMTAYKDLSLQELQEISRKAFLFYLKDEFMSRFWRLSQMEQYQNREIYNIYRSIFFEQSIKYQTELFAEMIRQGAFREADPEVVAVNFYAPIYFLLSKYQEESDVEEALRMLDKQIEEFYHIYKKQ
ncbi:TetR/AcrR family transcriptional regulator [Dorea sp. YH-dor226]|uniref:TetR/AcrR family transcriptional regulator n=1 Tax=Dorea sp. YH-dor226 TaxID=3151119 RepID=UPI003242B674